MGEKNQNIELKVDGRTMDLHEQYDIIKKQNDERGRMIKEIHHRAKNNMQIINSLLSLQSSKLKDERTIAMFTDCQNRIATLSAIHEKMYHSDDFTRINIQEYLSLLVSNLVESYQLDFSVKIKEDIPPLRMNTKTLIPLGLLINEIVTNSMNYSFEDQKNNFIYIKIKPQEKERYELIIGDSGIGISKKKKVKKTQNSLGTELIEIFTQQLEGTIERLNKQGTIYRITFKELGFTDAIL